jgi:hypothetical protein
MKHIISVTSLANPNRGIATFLIILQGKVMRVHVHIHRKEKKRKEKKRKRWMVFMHRRECEPIHHTLIIP